MRDIDLNILKDPFPENDVEWRIGRAGVTNEGKVWATCLAYITNRAIMDRLDSVCGAENWKNEFTKSPMGDGVLCGISIKVDGEWITKYDGAENTNFEALKGGLSGAMKRAAVQWGIGRYLYNIEEGYAIISGNGKHYQSASKDKKVPAFKWDAPKLPDWAILKLKNPETKKPTVTEIIKGIKSAQHPDTKKIEVLEWMEKHSYSAEEITAVKGC